MKRLMVSVVVAIAVLIGGCLTEDTPLDTSHEPLVGCVEYTSNVELWECYSENSPLTCFSIQDGLE